MTRVEALKKTTEKDQYGCLIGGQQLLETLYPRLVIEEDAPTCWAQCRTELETGTVKVGRKTYQAKMTLPGGYFSSKKHFHTAGWGVVEAESGHKKLNVRPLVLLRTYVYNGDYRSVSTQHYLFGKNEDGSYFLHRIRPKFGESIADARRWMWSLSVTETVAARQGDLALVPKKRTMGDAVVGQNIKLGNHDIWAEKITQTKNKTYALNPVLLHGEHREVALEGVFDLRLAKVWGGKFAD